MVIIDTVNEKNDATTIPTDDVERGNSEHRECVERTVPIYEYRNGCRILKSVFLEAGRYVTCAETNNDYSDRVIKSLQQQTNNRPRNKSRTVLRLKLPPMVPYLTSHQSHCSEDVEDSAKIDERQSTPVRRSGRGIWKTIINMMNDNIEDGSEYKTHHRGQTPRNNSNMIAQNRMHKTKKVTSNEVEVNECNSHIEQLTVTPMWKSLTLKHRGSLLKKSSSVSDPPRKLSRRSSLLKQISFGMFGRRQGIAHAHHSARVEEDESSGSSSEPKQ